MDAHVPSDLVQKTKHSTVVTALSIRADSGIAAASAALLPAAVAAELELVDAVAEIELVGVVPGLELVVIEDELLPHP